MHSPRAAKPCRVSRAALLRPFRGYGGQAVLPLALLIGLAAAAECHAGKADDQFKAAKGLIASAQKQDSLDQAVQQITSAQALVKKVAARYLVHPLLARQAREMREPLKKDLAQLKKLQQMRENAIELAQRRLYDKGGRIVGEMPAAAPKSYIGVVRKEMKRLMKVFDKYELQYRRWVKLTARLEDAFRGHREYLHWRRPAKLFAQSDATEILRGYGLGYDNPESKEPHYKLGWLAGALGKSLAEIQREFRHVRREPRRSLSHFFLALQHEENADFTRAREAFSQVAADALPDEVKAITARRRRMYDILATRWPQDRALYTDFRRIIDARRASPIGKKNALDRTLYPQAAAQVAAFLRRKFDQWLSINWQSKYAELGILYCRRGIEDFYPAATTPQGKKSLQPAIKLISLILFEEEAKGFNFTSDAVKAKYEWLGRLIDSAGRHEDPKTVAARLEGSIAENYMAAAQAYFELARSGDWNDAITALRKAWTKKAAQ